MSKITISAVLQIISLVLKLLEKSSRLIISVADLVDDGISNDSVKTPAWYSRLMSVIKSFDNLLFDMNWLQSDIQSDDSNKLDDVTIF